jgi:hypothetical protein
LYPLCYRSNSATVHCAVRLGQKYPAADIAPNLKEELKAFVKPHVSLENISALAAEGKLKVGPTGKSTFSRNVLQLEISGPRLPHHALVDPPDLTHHPNRDQTDDDVEIPKELARSYMTAREALFWPLSLTPETI